MKKSTIAILIAIAIVPAIMLLLGLTISGVNITEFPLWFLLIIPTLLIIAPFLFLFAQRFAQRKIYDQPLEKRKKPLLIVVGICVLVTAILLIMNYYIGSNDYFWVSVITQTGFLFFILFLFFRQFSSKKKESAEDGNQNNSKL